MDKNNDNAKALNDADAGSKNQAKEAGDKKFKIYLITAVSIILVGLCAFIITCLATNNSKIIKTVLYDGLVNNILAVPSLLIGIIVFLGYLLQKKHWTDALSGGFKGIIGYIILQIGSTFLVGVSKPLMVAFGKIIGSNTVLLDPYVGWSTVNEKLGSAVSVVAFSVLIGMAVNILLVAMKRITNVRSINVTGHIMFQQTATICGVLYFIVFRNVVNDETKKTLVTLTGGLIMGLSWGVLSNLAYKPTQLVTNNAGFSIGHQQMFGVWLASQTGKLFALNNKEVVSVETMKVKKGFKIFHDNLFVSSILMLLFFGTLMLIMKLSHPDAWNLMFNKSNSDSVPGNINFFASQNWVVVVVGLCFTTVAAIQIIMVGAKMFVGELQKSFIGISNKLIPGAVVAIDIAGCFSFSEKAITFGFISGAIGNFLAMGILILIGHVGKVSALDAIIMVGFIPMFFDNAAMGIYANSTGGWKAAITVPFVYGMVTVFGAELVVKLVANKYGIFTTGYNGMFDWNTIWAGVITLMTVVPGSVSPYTIILVVALFILIAQLTDADTEEKTPLRRLLFKKEAIKNNEIKKDKEKVNVTKE